MGHVQVLTGAEAVGTAHTLAHERVRVGNIKPIPITVGFVSSFGTARKPLASGRSCQSVLERSNGNGRTGRDCPSARAELVMTAGSWIAALSSGSSGSAH